MGRHLVSDSWILEAGVRLPVAPLVVGYSHRRPPGNQCIPSLREGAGPQPESFNEK